MIRLGSLAIACALGAASSSCLCRRRACPIPRAEGSELHDGMAFEFSSTNLVIELGMIMCSCSAGGLPSPSFSVAS